MADECAIDLCQVESLHAFLAHILTVVNKAVSQHTQVILPHIPILTFLADIRSDVVILAVCWHAISLVEIVNHESTLTLNAILLIIIETVFQFAESC